MALPKPVRFTLPLCPSVNAGYVETSYFDHKEQRMKKKRVPTKELADFKELAPWKLYEQKIIKGSWSGVEAVGWDGKFYLPRWSCDVDNYIKFWQDAVATWLDFNDKRVLDIHVRKFVDAKHPRVEIELFPLSPAQAAV